jgi:hypothetical protein
MGPDAPPKACPAAAKGPDWGLPVAPCPAVRPKDIPCHASRSPCSRRWPSSLLPRRPGGGPGLRARGATLPLVAVADDDDDDRDDAERALAIVGALMGLALLEQAARNERRAEPEPSQPAPRPEEAIAEPVLPKIPLRPAGSSRWPKHQFPTQPPTRAWSRARPSPRPPAVDQAPHDRRRGRGGDSRRPPCPRNGRRRSECLLLLPRRSLARPPRPTTCPTCSDAPPKRA